MGGPGAPDDMSLAAVTQAWLAVSPDPDARVTGGAGVATTASCGCCESLDSKVRTHYA